MEEEVAVVLQHLKGTEFTPQELYASLPNGKYLYESVAACLRKFSKEQRIQRTMHGIYLSIM